MTTARQWWVRTLRKCERQAKATRLAEEEVDKMSLAELQDKSREVYKGRLKARR